MISASAGGRHMAVVMLAGHGWFSIPFPCRIVMIPQDSAVMEP